MSDSEREGGGRYVSPAQVAEALGVGITTVKRWVDQGILPAHKTPGGHRKLLLGDVKRVVRQGEFPRADLGKLGLAGAGEDSVDARALASGVLSALRRGDGEEVGSLLRGALRSGMAIEEMADQVVSPAMRRLGHEWEEGRLEVWQEHRGTQLCAGALYEVRSALRGADEAGRPVAIGGGPEGDPYLLANLLAEMALLGRGWRVVNLGPNTPMGSFRAALEEMRPRLLWLSSSYLAEPGRFVGEYRGLYRAAEKLGTAVAVGGQALTEEVRSGMPYTTFGDGLSHLVAFAKTLHPEGGRPRRGRPRGS